MLKQALFATVALVGLGSLNQAAATLVPTDETFFTVATPSTVVFTFLGFDSAHTNIMKLVVNGQQVFINYETPVGTTFTTVFSAGANRLALLDVNTGNTWGSDPVSNSDGVPHLVSSTTFSDFGLGSTSYVGTYYGWEDLLHGGDRDYNDLVFGLNVIPNAVPEPASLLLLGAGVIGLAAMRRRA